MSTVTRLRADVGSKWSLTEATELYDVARWGQGYFSINEHGHLQVHPTKDPARAVDLKRLMDRLALRGLSAPILLRFTDILKHRLGEIHSAFQNAIAQHQYQGRYACVYPIKVNQQRQVVEEVLNVGRQYGFGLEAGSKPELLAVVALAENDTPIICNGFKDAEFIEMAMLAQKMGRLIIPVVEKYTELDLILHYAEKVGVRPNIGMRVKLAARGSGLPATSVEAAIAQAVGIDRLASARRLMGGCPPVDLVVGGGRLLAGAPHPADATLVLLDGLRPPGVTQLAIDPWDVCGPLGALPDEDVNEKITYLMSIDGAKFRRPVVPGDRLELHVEVVKRKGAIWRQKGTAVVDGQTVAEAEFMAMLADRES